MTFHVISFGSNKIKRVCRSTLQAEAFSLQNGLEEGDRIRAAIADLKGCLELKQWEATASKTMIQVWVTDCKSLESSLTRTVMSKYADKRLSIEMASLRQSLWRNPGEARGSPTSNDEKPELATDMIRWIDTDCMIADPLTKVMEPVKLVEALDSNSWSLKQPIESILKKRAKQLQRRKTPVENDDKESIKLTKESDVHHCQWEL